jgi:hypothetical protein
MTAPQDEDDHRLRHSSPCQTALLVPAPALLRPGFASLLHSPHRGGGRSAERRSGARGNTRGAVHVTRHARRLARRLASHDAGRSPLGAPPWRFWALRVPRFPPRRPPQLTLRQADRLQRAPRVQVLVPGGRGPYLPGQRLRAATAGRHTSLRIQDASRTRPLRARLRM